MNKKFKCIIFDLDGTLIDSGPDLLDSLNIKLVREVGFLIKLTNWSNEKEFT